MPVNPELGESVGLWTTLSERALEVGDVERRGWTTSKFTANPVKPDTIANTRFPALSPMAQKLTKARSVRSLGNIGRSELTKWYHAQPKSVAKHTKEEWAACQEHLRDIATVRSTTSDASRQLSTLNRSEGQAHLDIKQTQVKEAFQQRLGDLKLYHSKLSENLRMINSTINKLQASLEDMQAFMNSRFGWPGQVNTLCLGFRADRLGIENVADEVDASLESEGDMLLSVKEQSFEVLETEAKASLDSMKSFAGLLAADIVRKNKSINIDQRMLKMENGDKGLMLHLPDIQRAPGDAILTQEWLDATEKLLADSMAATGNATDLQERMKLSAKHSDMLVKQHENEVNDCFTVHLTHLKNAQELTSGLLQETKQSIVQTEDEITDLKEKLDAQVNPLKCTTTRLNGRRDRVETERTRDVVHESLVQEVAELDGVCVALSEELSNMETELLELRRVEGVLEEDFAMKSKSVEIDEKCVKLRSLLSEDTDPQKIKMMQRGGPWVSWGLRWGSVQ
jgi:hypothetical protein